MPRTSIDPRIATYREEKSRAARRTTYAQQMHEAQQRFARWIAAEAIRARGGRPPKDRRGVTPSEVTG